MGDDTHGTKECTSCGKALVVVEAEAAEEANEEITHCEWCGAEYPVPGPDTV
ncbi:MAG: hypothetical protein O2789_00530 [Actinomycetota bacterium]|jgi:hypothetical protein|nr:hypothetical protein [Actinomycetota bacterium]